MCFEIRQDVTNTIYSISKSSQTLQLFILVLIQQYVSLS